MTTAQTTVPPTRDDRTSWVDRAHGIGARLALDVEAGDRAGRLSTDAIATLRAEGILRLLVPVEFGGHGASHRELGDVLRALGRHDPSTAVTVAMHSHLVAAQVWRHQRGIDAATVLRKVADGALLISTGASDWLGSSGTTRRVEGGYRVSARKGPASGCEVGDVLVTSLRWDDGPDGPQVIHCSVPFGAPGVSVELTWDTMGLRATGSHTVVLDDVFVPDAAVSLIRPADRWHPVWSTVLGVAMPLIMAAYVGMADAALDHATQALAGRTEPHALQLLGEAVNAHTTASDVVAAMFAAGDDLRFDNTDAHVAATLSRKTVATESIIATVRLAIEAVGGVGYTRACELERLYRDVHGCLFHPLGRAKQTQLTARVALGHTPV